LAIASQEAARPDSRKNATWARSYSQQRKRLPLLAGSGRDRQAAGRSPLESPSFLSVTLWRPACAFATGKR
ncbi:hypothetical protein, partial [Vibrio vulnificus]|uniref:hypothetical protein n=1 Tax=Vibrio vulnificus TaxID=672 RepID=UPI001CA49077